LFNVYTQSYLIEPPAAPAEVFVLEGTLTSLEKRPASHSAEDWLATLKVDRVVKGRFDGDTFRFHVHRADHSGLSVGGKYTVEARSTANGYAVDQDRWKQSTD